GRALDFLLFRAEQHQNPDSAIVAARASWTRVIAAAATLQFICHPDALGANTHGALTMATTEAYALLGFANPGATPLCDALQITYLGQQYNIQNLDFEMANIFAGDAICELKQPLLIWPQESGLVSVRYFAAGNDMLRPIGGWIKMAQNCRALATS
ncbi:MAG: hypothetical protein PHQ43_13225, partial [Dehalococcoidales bacterium]|nr:hypothetical protein [Dehalococcoidales bacterium]